MEFFKLNIMLEKLIDLDKEFFIYLNNKESVTDGFWLFITDEKVMFIMFSFIIFFLLFKYDRNNFKITLFFILITFIATDLIHNHCFKDVFQRLRPCWDIDIPCRVLVEKGGKYGFVSGHAANFFGIIGIIFLRIPNLKLWIKDVLIIWGLLICYSRIHVGKHYPLDVFFGAILGVIIAYFLYRISKYLMGLNFFSQKVYKKRN